MDQFLRITIVDPDADYLGLDVRAENARYAGTARLYANVTELLDLAASLEGFPDNRSDRRRYTIGSRSGPGGFVGLLFSVVTSGGYIGVDVETTDDDTIHRPGRSAFQIGTTAAAIDQFIGALRLLDSTREGSAELLGWTGSDGPT